MRKRVKYRIAISIAILTAMLAAMVFALIIYAKNQKRAKVGTIYTCDAYGQLDSIYPH